MKKVKKVVPLEGEVKKEKRPPTLEKVIVRSFYDAQKLRVEMGNRISAHKRLGVLSEEWEKRLTSRNEELQAIEKALSKDVAAVVQDSDLWPWLKGVKGVGPLMAGVLLAELGDPARFDTISKLWAYCGLHTVEVEGEDRRMAPKKKRGALANWNQVLRAKLIGVLGPAFLKADSSYSNFYENYKQRLQNRPCSLPPAMHKRADDQGKLTLLPVSNCTKLHIHNKAMRYMVKMFLQDLWLEWRALRKLPIRPPYAEEYLGKKHSEGGSR